MSSKLFTLPIINTTDYFKTIKEIYAKRNVIRQDQIKQNPPAYFSLRDSNFDYTGTTLQESDEKFIDTNILSNSELEILARLEYFRDSVVSKLITGKKVLVEFTTILEALDKLTKYKVSIKILMTHYFSQLILKI